MATHKSILAFYREFLNDPGWHEDAYMLWEVIDRGIQYYDGEEYAKTADISAELSLKDCGRRGVTFQFELRDPDGRENSFKKLDRMIAGLQQLRRALTEALPLAEARHEASQAARKNGQLDHEL